MTPSPCAMSRVIATKGRVGCTGRRRRTEGLGTIFIHAKVASLASLGARGVLSLWSLEVKRNYFFFSGKNESVCACPTFFFLHFIFFFPAELTFGCRASLEKPSPEVYQCLKSAEKGKPIPRPGAERSTCMEKVQGEHPALRLATNLCGC